MNKNLTNSQKNRKAPSIKDWTEVSAPKLFDMCLPGIWIVSLDYKTEYVNRSLCELLGYTAQEMLGRQVSDFIPRGAQSNFKDNISKRAKGISENYSIQACRRDGVIIDVVVYANPIFSIEGKVIGAMAVLTEKTNRSLEVLSKSHLPADFGISDGGNLSCGNLELLPSRIQYSIDGVSKNVSVFVFKLLKYFIVNQGRVISRAELVENVWQGAVSNDRVVDAHIVSLRKALKNFDGEFRTVYGLGYLLSSKQSKRKRSKTKTSGGGSD